MKFVFVGFSDGQAVIELIVGAACCAPSSGVSDRRRCTISTFSSCVQRRRRATVLMISTGLVITALTISHKDIMLSLSVVSPKCIAAEQLAFVQMREIR